LLVGETRATDWVGNSELAFLALMAQLTSLGEPKNGASGVYSDLREPLSIAYVDPMPMPDTDPDLAL
jgi:hypothetical protein